MRTEKNIFMRAYHMLRSHPRISVLIFISVIIFCGLFFAKDYGIGWDDTNEQEILDSNMKPYVKILFGADSPEYAAYNNIAGISESVERDHGVAVYYAFSALVYLFAREGLPFRSFYILKHMYTFLIFAGGLFCLYLTVKRLTGRRLPAYFSTALMFFSPRFFAESTFNTKDLVLTSLVLMSIWFAVRLTDTAKHRYAAGFGIVCALATNTRIIGFWLAALAGILYIAVMCAKKSFRQYLPAAISTVLIFCAVYYIVTPAAWENPVAQLKYTIESSADFSRWANRVLYMGDIYSPVHNPLPPHYIPLMLALTTPPVTVLLMLWGIAASVIKIVRRSETAPYYLFILTFMAAPLMFYFIKGSNVYNSWRHFYFISGPLMIMAGEGISVLISDMRTVVKRAAAGIISAQLLISVIGIALSHPYEYGYLNFFAGKNAHERYELDYWNVAAMNALMTLADQYYSGTALYVRAPDYNSNDGLVKGYYMLPDSYREKVHLASAEVKDGKTYILVNYMYQRIIQLNTERSYGYPIEPYRDYAAEMEALVTVESYGNKMMIIYG